MFSKKISDLNLLCHILVFFLELRDNVQVLLWDVIIVLFHLSEGSFMVHHQVIDVIILALLDLVNLDLHS